MKPSHLHGFHMTPVYECEPSCGMGHGEEIIVGLFINGVDAEFWITTHKAPGASYYKVGKDIPVLQRDSK